jgi:hypothetical protein
MFTAAYVKGIQAVRIDFFWFILKVANIRCFILIKCSEQEARFKKYAIMSKLVKIIRLSVGGIDMNTPNYKSASYFRSLPNTDNRYE